MYFLQLRKLTWSLQKSQQRKYQLKNRGKLKKTSREIGLLTLRVSKQNYIRYVGFRI